jgi:oxalate decarboxylase/phosphoglucose isomerase-like protein (cupin superfamily)
LTKSALNLNVVSVIDFPRVQDRRGNLTFIQNQDHLPFDIQRVFWTYDVPGGENRGAHAYKNQQEIIIALSGSFDVVISKADGTIEKYSLNRSYYGLYLPPMTWRHMENFSTNALGLHLSSSTFDSDDYIRDFHEYQSFL